MPLGGPGPRDWSPSDSTPPPSRPGSVRPTALYDPSPYRSLRPRRTTSPWAFAALAMVLGGASLALGLLEPQRSGLPSGFVVSTIGVTAIVLGVRAVRLARWGSATVRAFGRGGAILGIAGTALMAYALLAFGLTASGVTLPAISLLALDHTTPSAPIAAAPRVDQPVTTPSPATAGKPASLEAERSALMQSAGTLAFTMEQRFGAGPYPASLVVSVGEPPRITLADGSGLAPVPDGARVLYTVAPDGSAWSVTITGSSFGAVATYSSAVGTIAAQ